MFDRVNSVLDRVLDGVQVGSLWLARAGGVLILLTVALVTFQVLSRYFVGRPAGHANEITGYVMAISASWSFAYTLMCKAHIRIDVLYLNFSTKVRGILDLIALLAMTLFCVLVVGAVFDVAMDSYSGGSTAITPLATPLWIPQTLWLLGLTWFSLAVCLLSLRVLFGVLSGDTEGVQKRAGSPSLDEQIKEENKEAAR